VRQGHGKLVESGENNREAKSEEQSNQFALKGRGGF